MSQISIEKRVEQLSLPILATLQYELVDIEFKKEGADWYLRIFIDKPDGINHQDCQNASEKISMCLDEADPITYHYILEVSSPGIERPIKSEKDYKDALGKMVEVKLFKKIHNVKIYKGILMHYDGNKIVLDTNDETITIDKTDIAIIKPFIKI